MKNQKLILFTILLTIPLLFAACKKESNDNPVDLTSEVTGTYEGSITPSDNSSDSKDAIIEISKVDENTIHLNMMSEHLDTTFMMDLYANGDSTMLCFTDADFQSEYNHEMSSGHNMMNDNNWQSWQNHMSKEHSAGDVHYGAFSMSNHSFTYRFKTPGSEDQISKIFTGTKIN